MISGLVLGSFLLTHFGNHALGLISIEAMEQGRGWFNALWRTRVGTVLLYGALLVHFALALQALYRRRTLRMPMREAVQLILGLLLPFLLIPHVTGTRIELAVTGREADYPEVIRGLWLTAPENGLRQAAAVLIAWLHFSLGIYFWLRPRSWFPRYALLLYSGALLLPLLALLGFAEAGKMLASSPDRYGRENAAPPPEVLSEIRMGLYLVFGCLLSAAIAARALRISWNWSTRLRITYPGGRMITVPRGFSVLEASRIAGIPHAAVCGGRGRCSTCRVRVLDGLEGQPPPTAQERATLSRIRAGANVRLACQFRPTHDLTVAPSVLSTGREQLAVSPGAGRAARGQERDIAVLFCDLRGFTSFSERRLPFDTVFILNRYFEVVGHAVEEAGGHVDKFVGDGALALFGLSTDPAQASRQAFDAALRIQAGVEKLNKAYASELEHPLQIAMSLHVGTAIVGELGYGSATSLTAVGDTLNVASRLEGLAKDVDAELVISDELARRAGLNLAERERRVLAVRGRSTPITVWIIPEASGLGPTASGSGQNER